MTCSKPSDPLIDNNAQVNLSYATTILSKENCIKDKEEHNLKRVNFVLEYGTIYLTRTPNIDIS
jgi:hypothetical protein